MQKLDQIEDEAVLKELLSILELELLEEPIRLSEDQKNMVNEGLEDIRTGQTYSSEEAKRAINEWLKKR